MPLRVLLTLVIAVNLSPPNAGQSVFEKSKNSSAEVASRLTPHSRFVTANGIRIHYLEWGRGDSAIVLLHGLYDSSDTWAAIAPLLASRYRIIAPDRRGAGLTDKASAGYDYQNLARDVESLIVALKLHRVNLVGHSAGAGVAMTLAAARPDKIRSLVLVDGGFWPKREKLSAGLMIQPCEDEATACQRREAMERAGNEYDPDKLFTHVTVPALLVLGFPPAEEAKKFAAELSEARKRVENVATLRLRTGQMAVIAGTSHWIHRDRPKQLARVIDRFIKRVH